MVNYPIAARAASFRPGEQRQPVQILPFWLLLVLLLVFAAAMSTCARVRMSKFDLACNVLAVLSTRCRALSCPHLASLGFAALGSWRCPLARFPVLPATRKSPSGTFLAYLELPAAEISAATHCGRNSSRIPQNQPQPKKSAATPMSAANQGEN